MKKTVFLLIIAIMLISLASCGSSTPDTGNFTCEFDTQNKTATVTGYTGTDKNVVIPEKFGDYTVTAIGRKAFSHKYEIESISIPASVKTLGPSCFEYCISIDKIALPQNLESIENTAFSNCRGLISIEIPATVKKIGICTFTGCTSLEEIKVDKNNKNYVSDSYGALLDKNETIVMQYPLGSQRTTYEMPNTVKTVASYAFERAEMLENVTFSESLQVIESYAFQGAGIREAVFGNSLTTIDSFCFNESMLQKLDLGTSVKTIGDSAFGWCTSLLEVNIPKSVEKIGESAFYMCTAVTKYTVDENNNNYSSDEAGSVLNKDMTVFMYYPLGNTLEEYTLPSTVTEIAPKAFSPTLNLKTVTIPDSVETIGDRAFAQCTNLENVNYEGVIPSNIADTAFEK